MKKALGVAILFVSLVVAILVYGYLTEYTYKHIEHHFTAFEGSQYTLSALVGMQRCRWWFDENGLAIANVKLDHVYPKASNSELVTNGGMQDGP